MDKNGKLKLSREILHRRLVAKHFEGVEKGTRSSYYDFPRWWQCGRQIHFHQPKTPIPVSPSDKQAVKVDPDAIKGMLPEYKSMVRKGNDRAASYSHEESSAIAKRVIDVAQRTATTLYWMVLVITNNQWLRKLTARNAGLKVEGVYCASN